jgi:hypothetical protein
MKNPDIELIKKWLDKPESVSQEELERTAAAADAADAAAAAAAAAVVVAAFRAVAADADVVAAFRAVASRAASRAKHWVERYEELTQ